MLAELTLIRWSAEAVPAGADVTELTLSRNLEALLVTKLPKLLPHAEIAAEALGTVLASFEVVVVEVADEMEATDARLNGRSLRSPPE
jgi:hypothetical protein